MKRVNLQRYTTNAVIHPSSRFNQVGVQMLPTHLSSSLFPTFQTTNDNVINLSKRILERSKLLGKDIRDDRQIDLSLPKMLGNDILEHFQFLSHLNFYQFKKLAIEMSNSSKQFVIPKKWDFVAGWTKYDAVNGTGTAVNYPDEEMLIFDVEVLVTEGKYPVMAVCMSPTNIYSWVSPSVIKFKNRKKNSKKSYDSLIKLGPRTKEKIIIGHNVGYDRARVFEEYSLTPTKTRWIDTMSLHMAVGGISSQQRPEWAKYKKLRDGIDISSSIQDKEILMAELKSFQTPWNTLVSTNSLKECALLYLDRHLDKEKRNVFVEGTMDDVYNDFQGLMGYCCDDVLVTFDLFKVLFPKYLEKCPDLVSFAGFIEMGCAFLPVNEEWNNFIQRSEDLLIQLTNDIEAHLSSAVDDALETMENEIWRENNSLKHLDWTIKEPSNRKIPEKLSLKHDALIGMPNWYRDLWSTKDQRIKITTRQRVAPYLLRLTWNGHNLYHSKHYGWTFYAPKEIKLKNKLLSPTIDKDKGVFDTYILENSEEFNFYRLPNKDGEGKNCGNPLSKSFLHHFEAGILGSSYSTTISILKKASQMTYWISARSRVLNQFVGWEDKVDLGQINGKGLNSTKAGVILPQIVPMGTVTRRAMEPLWMTAANAKSTVIGSELKSMVQAPTGFVFVGADVDSEELWIASLLGDAQFGVHGATPLGFMTLQGTKSLGTDMHSATAGILGITRDKAKVFNYARIYGAANKFAENLFSPDLTQYQIKEKALNLYRETKGLRQGSLKASTVITGKKFFDKVDIQRTYWCGGSESFTFNRLEDIARQEHPTTPALKCKIPECLSPANLRSSDDFLKSRINWGVQSSGVDYLHLLLVSVSYLEKVFGFEMRFVLSIHDEVRFMVKEENKYLAALALQVANVWTRAFFVASVGMTDLPLTSAFFSAVDIDICLRKEVTMDCVTPSNPTPIPFGESLDVYQTIEKLGISRESSMELYHHEDIPGLTALLETPPDSVLKSRLLGKEQTNSTFLAEFDDLKRQAALEEDVVVVVEQRQQKPPPFIKGAGNEIVFSLKSRMVERNSYRPLPKKKNFLENSELVQQTLEKVAKEKKVEKKKVVDGRSSKGKAIKVNTSKTPKLIFEQLE